MSPDEYREWKEEWVEIPILCVTGQSDKALFIQDQDDQRFAIGKSQIDNLEDLTSQLRRTRENQEKDKLVLVVPRWLAQRNGWEDDEPPE